VAAFLTPEWFSALGAEAQRSGPLPGLAPGERFVLGQEVHGVPEGDGAADGPVAYQLVVEADGIQVAAPPREPAHVTFVCDYPTAVDLACGTTNAQEALMAGRLRLRGDVERFAAAREALLAIGDVFARVRAATEYVRPHG
jgi:hypothetical protein